MIDRLLLLLGAPASGSGSTPGNPWVQMLPIVLIFLVFYFLLIRPQRKKQKETRRMIGSLKKDDRITTIGGIQGTVKKVGENTVIVEVDNKGATLEFTRNAIGSVNQPSNESASRPESKKTISPLFDNDKAKEEK